MNPGLSYRETSVAGASPVRLVILLYEQAIEDLRRATTAQEAGQIEERTRQINHAILVLGHLQATLDKEQGGRIAVNLERFYNGVRNSLIQAQVQQSANAIREQISFLMQIHEAWCGVEKALSPPAAQNASSQTRTSEWNA